MAQVKPESTAAVATNGPSATPDRGQPTAAQAADRPELAPGVELSGQMEESAFQDQQWLVQRDGRFIQLTELLYRVVEQIDGRRSQDEIAAQVTESFGKTVSAANVRQLLESKLIPLGLVLGADGKPIDAGGTAGVSGRSPLAVNFKMAAISPRIIHPFTRIMRFLYWPPVLVAALVAGILMQGWMFFVHGIGGSVRNALYAPGLMLAALGIIVLAAAFHEFGHATALHYGGGKVRRMGVGIYLVYPAFYTDVSDNYRLGRWSRVRTDLGGFYFNLIFGLAIMALYLVTGSEFLLLVVLLMDFDIIRQLMPFVRLDGYWALADITGIPDFFSHMGAFLRTVLPLSFWKGPKLPNLKTWVKLVYAFYILITVPLLAFLLFSMVRALPRVLATAWDSFGKLGGDLSTSLAHGNVLKVFADAVQIFALALPTFGMLFVLFSVGRRLAGALWRWSRPTPGRRFIGAAGAFAVVALLALLWAPRVPSRVPVRGGRPGLLYQENSFRPLTPSDRGTVSDVLTGVPVIGARPEAVPASARPTRGATATGAVWPTSTATATAEATATATGTATATATTAVGVASTATATAGALAAPSRVPSPVVTSPAGSPTVRATAAAASAAPAASSSPTAAAATPSASTGTPVSAAGTPTPTPPAAALQISGLTVQPRQAALGQTVAVSVQVENAGATPASGVLRLLVDGVVVDTAPVSLGARRADTQSFVWKAATAGNHQVSVGLAGGSTLAPVTVAVGAGSGTPGAVATVRP